MAKRVNKCPSWDEHWGCAISPMKNCSGCANADWRVEEKKTKALFVLSMPGVGSWNGKWSGEGRFYARTCTAFFRGKPIYPELKEGKFHYHWDDGWAACVEVKFVTPSEAKKAEKQSKGFCGYEWMVESLKKYGKIVNE